MVPLRWAVISIVLPWHAAESPAPAVWNSTLDSNEILRRQPQLAWQTDKPYWPHIKMGAMAGYALGYTLGYTQHAERNFYSHFDCFTRHVRKALEIYGRLPKVSVNNKIKLPDTIERLNRTRDSWMYESYPSPNNEKSATATAELKPWTPNGENKLTKYFQRWHSWTIDQNSQPKFFTELIIPALKSYFEEKKGRYQNESELHKIFAANQARFYLMLSPFFHGSLMSLLLDYTQAHRNCEFSEALFHFVPLWYCDSEQLDMLRILVNAYQDSEGFKRIKIHELRKKNKENDSVIVPFVYDNECGTEKIFEVMSLENPNN